MFKRICAVVLSLSLFITPSFAWSWESFVGKENLPAAPDPVYDLEPVLFSSRPMLMAADDGVALAAESPQVVSADLYTLFSGSSLSSDFPSPFLIAYYTVPPQSIGGISVPGYDLPRPYPSSPVSRVPSVQNLANGQRVYVSSGSVSVPEQVNGYDFSYFQAPLMMPSDYDFGSSQSLVGRTCTFDLDISSFGDFSSFSLSGDLIGRGYFVINSSATFIPASYLSVIVNGSVVRSFSLNPNGSTFTDLGNYVYSGSVPVTSLSISLTCPDSSFSSLGSSMAVGYEFRSSTSSPFTFTVLTGALGKPSGMDSADSALNDYQQQEGEYFAGANDAISDLDTSLSSNISGAAQMLGGLFNDLWSVMGDVKLLYFTPLLFGFFLWLIGRVRR